MSGRFWLRVWLWFVTVFQIGLGAWSVIAPRGFYDNFPIPGNPWVSPLPAYNEHLLRDFGGLNLGFALIFGVAAWTMSRQLAKIANAAYLCFAVPHLIFHLGHLEPFGPIDATLQVALLVAGVVVPAIVVAIPKSAALWQPSATSRIAD